MLAKTKKRQEQILEKIIKSIQNPEKFIGPNFSEIAGAVNVTEGTVSKYIRQMMKEGILVYERQGENSFYSIRPSAFKLATGMQGPAEVAQQPTVPPSPPEAAPAAPKAPEPKKQVALPSFDEIVEMEKLSARFLMSTVDKKHAFMSLYLDGELDRLSVPKRRSALELAFGFTVLQKDKVGAKLICHHAHKAGLQKEDLATMAAGHQRTAFYKSLTS